MIQVTVVVLLCVLVVAVTARLAFIFFKKHKQKANRLFFNGLALIQSFKDLLSTVQTHRGMTTRYLSGDYACVSSIRFIQSQVTKQIINIEARSPEICHDDLWKEFTRNWSVLASRYEQRDVESNIRLHSTSIRFIFTYISNVIEQYGLSRLKTKDALSLQCLWQELLMAAEYAGQLRAIGVGVINSGDCPSSTIRQLHHLSIKLTETCRVAWLNQKIDQEQERMLLEVTGLFDDMVLDRLLEFDADDYFTLCTGLIDSLFLKYDEVIDGLRHAG